MGKPSYIPYLYEPTQPWRRIYHATVLFVEQSRYTTCNDHKACNAQPSFLLLFRLVAGMTLLVTSWLWQVYSYGSEGFSGETVISPLSLWTDAAGNHNIILGHWRIYTPVRCWDRTNACVIDQQIVLTVNQDSCSDWRGSCPIPHCGCFKRVPQIQNDCL